MTDAEAPQFVTRPEEDDPEVIADIPLGFRTEREQNILTAALQLVKPVDKTKIRRITDYMPGNVLFNADGELFTLNRLMMDMVWEGPGGVGRLSSRDIIERGWQVLSPGMLKALYRAEFPEAES